jgi:hypothetical protein
MIGMKMWCQASGYSMSLMAWTPLVTNSRLDDVSCKGQRRGEGTRKKKKKKRRKRRKGFNNTHNDAALKEAAGKESQECRVVQSCT